MSTEPEHQSEHTRDHLDRSYETLVVTRHAQWMEITLNRPTMRNAMSAQMVRELSDLTRALSVDSDLQALVLRGAGGHFCAGGDIREMKQVLRFNIDHTDHTDHTDASSPHQDREFSQSSDHSADPLTQMNRDFGALLERLEALPQVVLVALEGAVMGGGLGLACISDIAFALPSARFGLPEVTLGITPAQIAPFVVARVGITRVRQLALTGARFDAQTALTYGLIHEVCADEDALTARITATLRQISACAPAARSHAKRLILAARGGVSTTLLDAAAHEFAQLARGAEAEAGMRAFIERTSPSWERAWGEVSYD